MHPSLTALSSPGSRFLWATGMEDTFVPQVRRGHRALDEYELIGHYEHWRQDLALAGDLGVHALRWGVPWYRVEPQPGKFDWHWTDEVLPYLVRDVGVLPIVDLMHYGCPLWLDQEFAHPDYPELVARYAHAFAERYRSLVSWYTPLNEPLINSIWCGKRGLWPPYLRGERGYVTVMMQLCRGIVRTVDALRSVDPASIMVHVEAAGMARAAQAHLRCIAEEEQARIFLSYDLITGCVGEAHPLFSWLIRHGASLAHLDELANRAVTLDVVGLNFYPQWSTVEFYADRDGRMAMRTVEKDGAGFAELLVAAYARYSTPVMVTETSAHGGRRMRSRWLHESIAAVKHVRERGIPVIGYTWFPMTTMVEWHYRFSLRPLEAYYVELGLYQLNRAGHGSRWNATPLVADLQRCIADTERSVGVLAGPGPAILPVSSVVAAV